jgi:glycosyltransferase involved in cell wall biosynthesis
MSAPLVTVVTPAWQRRTMLLRRCIPSVLAQDYAGVEHIIVSDGPDPALRVALDGWPHVRYAELPAHPPDPHYGIPARLAALELAAGEYVTYCDDDDSLRPGHCRLLAAALDDHPEAGFAVSRMVSHSPHGDTVIGLTPLMPAQDGTPMNIHRRELTERVCTWGDSGALEDWYLVQSWLNAGVQYARVDADTCDCWPSVFRGAGADPPLEVTGPPGLLPGEPRVWADGAERATITDLARPAAQ